MALARSVVGGCVCVFGGFKLVLRFNCVKANPKSHLRSGTGREIRL